VCWQAKRLTVLFGEEALRGKMIAIDFIDRDKSLSAQIAEGKLLDPLEVPLT
jgi:hypothetical protein